MFSASCTWSGMPVRARMPRVSVVSKSQGLVLQGAATFSFGMDLMVPDPPGPHPGPCCALAGWDYSGDVDHHWGHSGSRGLAAQDQGHNEWRPELHDTKVLDKNAPYPAAVAAPKRVHSSSALVCAGLCWSVPACAGVCRPVLAHTGIPSLGRRADSHKFQVSQKRQAAVRLWRQAFISLSFLLTFLLHCNKRLVGVRGDILLNQFSGDLFC